MGRAAAVRAGAVAVLVVGLVLASVSELTRPAEAAPGADPESSAVAGQVHAEALVPGTPCSVSTRACVDLDSQQAWLIRDGAVVRGPIPIASGGNGSETPVGHSFRVHRKSRDHVSGEFTGPDGRPAPMPFSVFFADGGIAFHGGDRNRASAGCVKLDLPEAEAVFADLAEGDRVQVVRASVEEQARAGAAGQG